MANELKHVSVGVQLTQAEYESITGHQFANQATGDVLYASSATQLSRLAIGGANAVLIVSGGIPAWATTLAGLTLTAPTINGTVATTGLTLPAHQLSGNITGTSVNFQINRDIHTDLAIFNGGTDDLFSAYWTLYGKNHSTLPGYATLIVPNAAKTGRITVFQVTGATNTPLATWLADHAFGAKYTEYTERAAPGAGAANTARIYALEGAGDTLTDLCAVFQDGSIAVFAQETTPLDSPRFAYPDNTEVKVVLRKPHPGVVRFVAVFPDGKEEVLNETLYTDTERVAANKGARAALPAGWKLETQAQRNARAVDLEAARVATLSRE